jgi:uncharacterized protein YceH (UPF0502 family)
MKCFGALALAVLVTSPGLLLAQTKYQRVPTGVGQKESLFEERHSPATEKRIQLSEFRVQTQAETIRKLEARIRELEAELAALKAGQTARVPETSAAGPQP